MSLEKFCRLKVILIQFFPVALSVLFLLVYAKCNFASVYLFADSTNCSGFRKYNCRLREFTYFCSDFGQYIVFGICLWNLKQPRISQKSSNAADFGLLPNPFTMHSLASLCLKFLSEVDLLCGRFKQENSG